MFAYRYKAIDQRGKICHGEQAASNDVDLELRLSRLGLDLIRHKKKKPSFLRARISSVKRQEIITFSFHLEQLLSAGVPLIDALRDLRDSESSIAFKAVIAQILDGIDSGKAFSAMLDEFVPIFGTVYPSVVRVGEHSGTLSDVLRDLTEHLKWQDELVAKLHKAAMYPAFVGAVLLLVIVFIMAYLVPELVAFIANTDYSLPWYTRALLATSDFIVRYWPSLALTIIAIPLAVKAARKYSPLWRYQSDKWVLRLWLIGPILLRFQLARFANYAAIMYASGITVLELLHLSRRLIDNRVICEAIGHAQQAIEQGHGIAESFDDSGLFPALVVRMLKVGENSGALDQALWQIGYFYGRETRESIERFESLIGAVLILLVGSILLWVIVSVVLPLIDTAVGMGSQL